MTKGGKREGAGRKLSGSSPAIMRSLRINEDDWQQIKELAKINNMSIPQYIVKMSIPQQD